MRVCDAAVLVLRETGNPGLMWGDEWLLHDIAEKLGWKHDAWRTSRRVLQALSRTPGPLIKKYVRAGRRGCVLAFDLPKDPPAEV